MKRKHETRTEFFLSEGVKVQRDEGRGKTLLGDNTGHRAVVKLDRSGYSVLKSGFHPDSIAYTFTVHHVYTQLRLRKIRPSTHLPERNYCVGPGVYVVSCNHPH
jgi:hypothetical protein